MKNIMFVCALFISLTAMAGGIGFKQVQATAFNSSFKNRTYFTINNLRTNHRALWLSNVTGRGLQKQATLKRPLPRREYSDPDCPKFKGMIIGGSVALGVGIGMFAGGVFIIDQLIKGNTFGDGDFSEIGAGIGGAALIVWGLAGIGAGIPVLAIGATNYSRYCRKEDDVQSYNLRIIQRGNTAGLALKF